MESVDNGDKERGRVGMEVEKMTEPKRKPQQSIDQVAAEFIKDLLRHFHHDPPDVSEDPDEAAAA